MPSRGECDFMTMDMPLNRRVTWAFFYNHEGAQMEEPFRDVFPESARGSKSYLRLVLSGRG